MEILYVLERYVDCELDDNNVMYMVYTIGSPYCSFDYGSRIQLSNGYASHRQLSLVSTT